MRLTEKNGRLYVFSYVKKEAQIQVNHYHYVDMYNKLADLEDIEEELGIDLITLFRAVKDGVWSKGGWYEPCYLDAEPEFIKPEDLRIGNTWYIQQNSENDYSSNFTEKNKLCLFDMDYEVEQHIVKVCDYGKTWALTKEELEK